MIKAADLKSGQTIIQTDRPGFDARNVYGTIAEMRITPRLDTMGFPLLLVTFHEAWATPVYLRPFDRVEATFTCYTCKGTGTGHYFTPGTGVKFTDTCHTCKGTGSI